jgi:hypothetical protein
MIRGSLLVLSAFTFVATALPRLAAQPSIELVAEDLAFHTNMAWIRTARCPTITP